MHYKNLRLVDGRWISRPKVNIWPPYRDNDFVIVEWNSDEFHAWQTQRELYYARTKSLPSDDDY